MPDGRPDLEERIKEGARRRALEALKNETRTIIFYESPHRLLKSLTDMREILGDRRASVSREMTKKFEETVRGTLSEVLEHFRDGPQSGIFTDGGARPNPGPGGWGMVHVCDGKILAQRHGHAADTTNNRMELTALIEAYKLLPHNAAVDIYSDSELCVNTINKWAPAWEKRGWRRKDGPIKNLELVQELYALSRAHLQVKLRWIKAHNGWLWNEYADSLATAWARKEL